MTIETKYNVDDEVYIVLDKTIYKAKVLIVNPSIAKHTNYVQYTMFNIKVPVEEKEIFSTEEEARNSIKCYDWTK